MYTYDAIEEKDESKMSAVVELGVGIQLENFQGYSDFDIALITLLIQDGCLKVGFIYYQVVNK